MNVYLTKALENKRVSKVENLTQELYVKLTALTYTTDSHKSMASARVVHKYL